MGTGRSWLLACLLTAAADLAGAGRGASVYHETYIPDDYPYPSLSLTTSAAWGGALAVRAGWDPPPPPTLAL